MDGLENDVISNLVANGTMASVLAYFLRVIWLKMQEKDKALIDFLRETNQQQLASQQRQIESDERTRSVMSELGKTIERTNDVVMERLASIESQIKPPGRTTVRKHPATADLRPGA